MLELREIDEIAFVRYASVYRRFQDIEEFEKEIESLRDTPSAADSRSQISIFLKKMNHESVTTKRTYV